MLLRASGTKTRARLSLHDGKRFLSGMMKSRSQTTPSSKSLMALSPLHPNPPSKPSPLSSQHPRTNEPSAPPQSSPMTPPRSKQLQRAPTACPFQVAHLAGAASPGFPRRCAAARATRGPCPSQASSRACIRARAA